MLHFGVTLRRAYGTHAQTQEARQHKTQIYKLFKDFLNIMNANSSNQPMEVTITYETLFDILRREKNHEDLQQLSDKFYEDLVHYLNEKKQVIERTHAGPFDEAAIQLANIKKMIRELHDRREKKILTMAVDYARSGVAISTNQMLSQEKLMYQEVSIVLEKYLAGILQRILQSQLPMIHELQAHVPVPEEKKKKLVLLRFSQPVPRFLGKNLEPYGPFNVQDIAQLPEEIAKVLISQEKAEALEVPIS